MAFVQWEDKFNIGVWMIDQQHRRLIDTINKLHEIEVRPDQQDPLIKEVINDLTNYVRSHFTTEEEIMRIYEYPGLEKHLKEHRDFANRIEEFNNIVQEGEMNISDSVLNYLKRWLTHHIMEVDGALGPFLNERGLK